jgi:hypothetical protein
MNAEWQPAPLYASRRRLIASDEPHVNKRRCYGARPHSQTNPRTRGTSPEARRRKARFAAALPRAMYQMRTVAKSTQRKQRRMSVEGHEAAWQ